MLAQTNHPWKQSLGFLITFFVLFGFCFQSNDTIIPNLLIEQAQANPIPVDYPLGGPGTPAFNRLSFKEQIEKVEELAGTYYKTGKIRREIFLKKFVADYITPNKRINHRTVKELAEVDGTKFPLVAEAILKSTTIDIRKEKEREKLKTKTKEIVVAVNQHLNQTAPPPPTTTTTPPTTTPPTTPTTTTPPTTTVIYYPPWMDPDKDKDKDQNPSNSPSHGQTEESQDSNIPEMKIAVEMPKVEKAETPKELMEIVKESGQNNEEFWKFLLALFASGNQPVAVPGSEGYAQSMASYAQGSLASLVGFLASEQGAQEMDTNLRRPRQEFQRGIQSYAGTASREISSQDRRGHALFGGLEGFPSNMEMYQPQANTAAPIVSGSSPGAAKQIQAKKSQPTKRTPASTFSGSIHKEAKKLEQSTHQK